MLPELSIIIPILNENETLPSVIADIRACQTEISWEIILVDDDSSDGTRDTVAALIKHGDTRLRLIHRTSQRGLSSACMEGMAASSAPYMAIMDGDGQHDAALLPAMLAQMRNDECDLIIATRDKQAAAYRQWPFWRRMISRIATLAAQPLLEDPIRDPMSGFFMLTRGLYNRFQPHYSAQGFKLLLDVLISTPGHIRYGECLYDLKKRRYGKSKVTMAVFWHYGCFLSKKYFLRLVA